MTATFLDVIILTIISISSLLGVIYGLINVLVSTISFFGTLVLASFIFPYVVDLMNLYVENDILSTILSAIASYIASLLLFMIFKSVAKKVAVPLTGNFINKFLGLLFGLIRGFIFASIFLLCLISLSSKKPITKEVIKNMEYTQDEKPEWLFSSHSFFYFSSSFRTFNTTFPQFYDKIYDFIIDQALNIKFNQKDSEVNNNLQSKIDTSKKPEKLDDMLTNFFKDNKNQ